MSGSALRCLLDLAIASATSLEYGNRIPLSMARKNTKPPVIQVSADRSRRVWPAIPWNWIAAGLSMVLLAWLATAGDWDFFRQAGPLEGFFDAQAQSLIHG